MKPEIGLIYGIYCDTIKASLLSHCTADNYQMFACRLGSKIIGMLACMPFTLHLRYMRNTSTAADQKCIESVSGTCSLLVI